MQQFPARLAAYADELADRGANTVPGRDVMAVLGPGEDPGDGAQVIQGLGAEAPRRTRADVHPGELVHRAGRIVVVHQSRGLRQLPVVGIGKIGKGFQGFMKFRPRPQGIFLQ